MKNRIFACVSLLLVVLLCFSVNVAALSEEEAHTQSDDVEYQYLSRMPYMEIVKFMPKDKTVTLPESFEGRPIAVFESDVSTTAPLTHIYVSEDNKFFTDIDGIVYDRSLTALVRVPHHRAGKIVVREGVDVICDGAFNGCENVTEIVLPKSLKEIGYWAFKDCSLLKKIVIPKSVETVGFDWLEGCKALQTIQIQNPYLEISVEDFENTAFYKNKKNWKNGVLYTDKLLVAANDSVPADYKIKDGTEAIAANAFANNKSLKSVHLPDSIKSIGDRAFYECGKLSKVRMPDVGCCIGSEVFLGAPLLGSGEDALYVGKHLIYAYKTSAVIHEGTLSIAKNAFPPRSTVGTLKFPASLTTLSMPILSYDSTLYAVEVDPANENLTVHNGVLYDKTMKKLILSPTSVMSHTVAPTTECIGRYAFQECRHLTNLNLPDSLKKIEEYAFDACIRLPKLVIPDSLVYIGYGATHDCCDLQNIKIGKGLIRATLCTFALEHEGYVDVPCEAEYIAPSHMWKGTTLLVASNSFALEFAKAYNIPYQINKEGPKKQPDRPKPESSETVVSKPVASKPTSSKPIASKPVASKPIASQDTSVESRPSVKVETNTVPQTATDVVLQTPSDMMVVGVDGNMNTAESQPTQSKPAAWPVVVALLAILAVGTAACLLIFKKKK